MFRPQSLLLAAAFGLVAVMAGALMIRTTTRPLASLPEEALRKALGADPHSYVGNMNNCRDNVVVFPPNSVYESGCTNDNINTYCEYCDDRSNHTNMNVFVDTSRTFDPGVMYGTSYSCGAHMIGRCQIVNGMPVCADAASSGQCALADEYWAQSGGSGQ